MREGYILHVNICFYIHSDWVMNFFFSCNIIWLTLCTLPMIGLGNEFTICELVVLLNVDMRMHYKNSNNSDNNNKSGSFTQPQHIRERIWTFIHYFILSFLEKHSLRIRKYWFHEQMNSNVYLITKLSIKLCDFMQFIDSQN